MRVQHLLPGLLLLASCSSEPSQELVGTWRGPSGDFLLTLTFAADGTLIETAEAGNGPQTRSASWRLAGGSLFTKTILETPSGRHGREFESSIYLTRDTLVRGAFVPVGDHAGVVGTWRRRQASADWDVATDTVGPQVVLEGTLTLRKDGTTHMELRLGLDLRVIEGSYSVNADGVVDLNIGPEDDPTFQEFPVRLIDDAALGSTVMTRQ